MTGVLIDIFRASYEELYIATFVVAVFLLLSGLDDIFVDMYYWFHHLFDRKNFNRYRYDSPGHLGTIPEKPIAIFVPAWHEQDVIDRMLTKAVSTIQYGAYDIFVGVYPNDPETIQKVEETARKFPNIHTVISGKPGPTTKADNLNSIHAGMLRWENTTGIRYDIVLLHDAEDVIHPMSLKVHNAFIPQYDMVQIPVFPLPVSQVSVVHWTYADEFSENLTKDVIARQRLSGFVPSAGVGTSFNRWMIDFVGSSFAHNIFRPSSLTEDYDLALRLALGQANLLYVYKPFGINVETRAYFPYSFRSAVRQRSRWIMGICLQAWKTIGWRGEPKFRFTLYRDRKALLSNFINLGAYVVVTYMIMYEVVRFALTAYADLPPIVRQGTLLWNLVVIDTMLMLWRVMHRFICVNRVYGVWPAFLSLFRHPISNVINMAATGRALVLFFRAAMKKREPVWEKTAHHYPTT
jgi:adsorption protein B